MAEIYADGNYVIINDGTNPQIEIPKNEVKYLEDDTQFALFIRDKSDRGMTPLVIAFDDAADWDDDSEVAYSESTLRTFLRENSGS